MGVLIRIFLFLKTGKILTRNIHIEYAKQGDTPPTSTTVEDKRDKFPWPQESLVHHPNLESRLERVHSPEVIFAILRGVEDAATA
jgi:hypothetical protein